MNTIVVWSLCFYGKRCRGGTEVSVNITCDRDTKGIVWKERLRPKRGEEGHKGK